MSLAVITKEMRLILKLGGVALAIVVVLFLVISGGSFVKNAFFPAPPAPPEEKFGALPAIEFPPVQVSGSHDYKVNTISGSLPVFATQAKVFKTIQATPSITDLQKARTKMAAAGYTANETKITDTVYKWSQPDGSATVSYDIVSHNFSLSTDYLVNPKYQTSSGISDREVALKTVTDLIDSFGALREDIDLENSKISYSALTNGRLLTLANAATAQFTNVNLLQNAIEKMNIYYPTPTGSTLNFTISNSNQPTVIEGNYPYIQPSTESSTYPIKTTKEAFADLQNGKAYIVQDSSSQAVDITDVQLGYYIGLTDNGYIAPIFVFSGNNFKAYVIAIQGS